MTRLAGRLQPESPASTATTASCRTSGRGASGVSHELFAQCRRRPSTTSPTPRATSSGVMDINEPVNAFGPASTCSIRTASSFRAEARNVNFQRVLQTPDPRRVRRRLQVGRRCRSASGWRTAGAAVGLHAAEEPLRRPRQPGCAAGVAGQRHPGRLRAVRLRPPAGAGRRAAPTTRGDRSPSPGVMSAITGAPINETVGTDVNGDSDNNDRPIAGHQRSDACRSVGGGQRRAVR